MSALANGRTTIYTRPFQQLSRQAARLGFKLLFCHEAELRQVSVRLEPETDHALQAIKRAGGPETDGIEVAARYSLTDDHIGLGVHCAEVAIGMAKDALA
jgi:hypothetical protein